jgi:hypothetical protein
MELNIITDSSQEPQKDPMEGMASPFLPKEKHKDFHPDFAAAALAHSTKLSEMLMRGEINPDQSTNPTEETDTEEQTQY